MLGFIEQSFGTGVIPRPVGKSLATLVHRFDETVKSFYVRTDPDNTEHFLETEEDAARISHSTSPCSPSAWIHSQASQVSESGCCAGANSLRMAGGGRDCFPPRQTAWPVVHFLSFPWKAAQDLGSQADPQPPNPCQPLPEFDPSAVLKEKLLVSTMWVPAEHGSRGFFVSFGAAAKAQFRSAQNFRLPQSESRWA